MLKNKPTTNLTVNYVPVNALTSDVTRMSCTPPPNCNFKCALLTLPAKKKKKKHIDKVFMVAFQLQVKITPLELTAFVTRIMTRYDTQGLGKYINIKTIRKCFAVYRKKLDILYNASIV